MAHIVTSVIVMEMCSFLAFTAAANGNGRGYTANGSADTKHRAEAFIESEQLMCDEIYGHAGYDGNNSRLHKSSGSGPR